MIALLLLAALLADEPRASVRGPEPAVVRVGETATIFLTVDGPASTLALAPLPAVDGVEWSASAPVESVAQRIGARAVETAPSTEWTISVTPRRAGAFQLPALVVEERGQPKACEVGRLEAIADFADDTHASVELSAPRDRCFLGETLEVTLRVAYDREFFTSSAVHTFLQPTDVAIAVESPGFDERRGGRAASGQAFVLNGRAVDASQGVEREVGGRTFAVLEVTRAFTPERSGEIAIPAPLLRFAWASSFQRDPFGARVASDKNDALVRGRPLAIRVDPLPVADPPPGFTGAVGRVTIRASADRTEVAAGESVKLTVTVEGEGNLTRFALPQFPAPREFHARGRVERRDARGSVVVFDVAPRSSEVKALPPMELVYFDPSPPGRYRTARTDPIALTVHGEDSAKEPPTRRPADPEPESRPPSVRRWTVAPLLIVFVIIIAARRRRLRQDAERKEREKRLRDIATSLGNALISAESDLATGLTEYLASRLNCPPAAVITPDLARRLERAKIPFALAERTASTLNALVATRYGGSQAPVDADEVRRLIAELERVFGES